MAEILRGQTAGFWEDDDGDRDQAERGPDDQPTGRLRNRSGLVVPFTGWLGLIRAVEDDLRATGPVSGGFIVPGRP
jgi:hypothetical protein